MAKRKVAFHKRKQNRFAMLLVTVVLGMLVITVSVKKAELRQKQETYAKKQEQLELKIEEEEKRATELEEYEKYTQTDKYIEDVAKEKLGLVYEDEILFKTEDAASP